MGGRRNPIDMAEDEAPQHVLRRRALEAEARLSSIVNVTGMSSVGTSAAVDVPGGVAEPAASRSALVAAIADDEVAGSRRPRAGCASKVSRLAALGFWNMNSDRLSGEA